MSIISEALEKYNTLNEKEEKKDIKVSVNGKDVLAKTIEDVQVKGKTVIVTISGKDSVIKHESEEKAKEHAENIQEMVNKSTGKPYDAKDGGKEVDDSKKDN